MDRPGSLEALEAELSAPLTMPLSWELLAWAMPRTLVVCMTSTEKLGSQLAMREPEGRDRERSEGEHERGEETQLQLCCTAQHRTGLHCTGLHCTGLHASPDALTVKVEEVVLLVDVWPGVGPGPGGQIIIQQLPASLLPLAPALADVQRQAARRTGSVLLQPGAQTGTRHATKDDTQNTNIHSFIPIHRRPNTGQF